MHIRGHYDDCIYRNLRAIGEDGVTFLDIAILLLATLYLAEAITAKDGPFGAFRWIRQHLPLGGLTACVWCLAPWLAALLLAVYLLVPYGHYAVLPFALAGGALALRSYTGVQHG